MDLKEKESWELFFEMERDYNLFSIHTKGGFPAWDIIRPHTESKILYPNFNQITIKTKYNYKIRSYFRVVYSLIKFYKSEKGGSFFFGVSRLLNSKQQYYDPYFEQVKNLISDKCLYYESSIGKDKYSENKIIFNFIPHLKQIISRFPFIHIDTLVEKDLRSLNPHSKRLSQFQ